MSRLLLVNKLLVIVFAFICSAPLAQNKISRCLSTDTSRWNNCIGSYKLPDGSAYVGTWVDGDYEGKGTQTFPNGNSYQGDFKNGKRNGTGTYIFFNNDRYVGEFKNGKREGRGTYIVYNGSQYQAEFRNDIPEGKGIEITLDGTVKNGHWVDGIFVALVNSSQMAPKDEPKELADKAKQGDAEAQYRYGMTFIIGSSDQIKPRIAIEWLMKAAAQGHVSAKREVASMYDFGVQMSTMESAIKVR